MNIAINKSNCFQANDNMMLIIKPNNDISNKLVNIAAYLEIFFLFLF